MKKRALVVWIFVIAAMTLLAGCGGGGGGGGEGGSNDTAPVSSAKAITAFSLGGVTGTINETAKSISVTMPNGTNITALIATFTTTGTSVKVGSTIQTSGTTANDFTSPVSYMVTAADNSTATYTVTVTVAAITVNLPKTGQTISYAAGDDGDLEIGFAWPNPRFTAGTGVEADCVTDNLTGLMWVKAPDATKRTWATALTYTDGLTLCGFSDWRLPNINELRSLVNHEQANIATWLTTQGFSNVQSAYWSSTTTDYLTSFAWIIYYSNSGNEETLYKGVDIYVWPVRDQGAYTARLPKTGQTTSYATGDDGDLQKGIAWPNPRFTVGTGAEADCVTDNLTGLMWVKVPSANQRAWASALTYADGLTICGFSDWRLPNVNELASLIHAEQADIATWLNTQGFSDVQASIYWSSTTLASNTYDTWVVKMLYGNVFYGSTFQYYAWPVRGGQ